MDQYALVQVRDNLVEQAQCEPGSAHYCLVLPAGMICFSDPPWNDKEDGERLCEAGHEGDRRTRWSTTSSTI
jgi:hypothetical protein